MLRNILIALIWMLFVQITLPNYTGNQSYCEVAYQRDVKPAVYIIEGEGSFINPLTLSI